MPNWCSTAYAIEGNATELKKLYELMKDLEKRQKPSVKNGFGTTWLGCLVEALGESWEKIYEGKMVSGTYLVDEFYP